MGGGRRRRRARICRVVALIFVTIGTQLPFPRLIEAIDVIAPQLADPIIAQVGADEVPRENIETHSALAPADFEAVFQQARIIVAHAGIGTILMAKQLRKPLVLVPRRYDMGEHRNDHQMATARELTDRPGIKVAWDLCDLASILRAADMVPLDDSVGPSSERLIARIQAFVEGQTM